MAIGAEERKKAKVKAGRYCAMGERSSKQVLQKLLAYGMSLTEAEQIVAELIQDRFVDDLRFSRAFANDKFRFNKWGRRRIALEMKMKHGLAEEQIAAGLEVIEENEYQAMIESLLNRKWQSLSEDLSQIVRKKRTVEFLVRKGFESDLAYAALDQIVSRTEH